MFTDDCAKAGHRRFEDLRFCISSLRGWFHTGPGGIYRRHRGWIISFRYRFGGYLQKPDIVKLFL
jgi:hypothetical protein